MLELSPALRRWEIIGEIYKVPRGTINVRAELKRISRDLRAATRELMVIPAA